MTKQIRKARRGALPLRVALFGKSGQGKTYTALALAHHLTQPEGICVVDSEVVVGPHGPVASAEKYVGEACRCSTCQGHGATFGEFSTILLEPNERSPKDYVEALAAAKNAGYPVVVLDSISHEWEACLEIVDAVKKRGGNAYAQGWGRATQAHNEFLAALMAYPGHVIVTMRAKEKHKQGTDGGGKKQIQSLGVLPIQREGIEYEFDVACYLEGETAYVVKTRAARLSGDRGWFKPGGELAAELKAWADGPTAAQDRAQAEANKPAQAPLPGGPPQPEPIDPALVEAIGREMAQLPEHLRAKVEEDRPRWSASQAAGLRVLARVRELVQQHRDALRAELERSDVQVPQEAPGEEGLGFPPVEAGAFGSPAEAQS